MSKKSLLPQLFIGLTILGGLVAPQVGLAAAGANSTEVIVGKSSTLSGGINQDNLSKCIYNYNQTRFKAGLVDAESPYLLRSDLADQFKDKDYCEQAEAIYENSHYLPAPQTMKLYEKVAVYKVYMGSKGKTQYYMIDADGQILHLGSGLALSSANGYSLLAGKYPTQGSKALTLRNTARGYPTSARMPEGMLRLTFRQNVTYGPSDCISCKVAGIAKVAYDFDKDGEYIQSDVLSIDVAHRK